MNRIKQAIIRWLAPSLTLYVVARTRDDKITDVEVYTDMDVATRRQRALGQRLTIMAERRVDDPRWEEQHLRAVDLSGLPPHQQAHLTEMRRLYGAG